MILFNYGVTLSDAGDLAAARDTFLEASHFKRISCRPASMWEWCWNGWGRPTRRLSSGITWQNAVVPVDGNAIGYKTVALKQIARVLETARYEAQAEDALRLSLEINPHQREPIQHWIFLRQGQCKWPVLTPWANVTRPLLMESFYPLSLAYYADDPLFQLGTANQYSKLDVGRPAIATVGSWPAPLPTQQRRLRVGYLSSDLRAHAVGFLTSEMFELHDRKQVEVFAYYCGIRAEDETKARIRRRRRSLGRHQRSQRSPGRAPDRRRRDRHPGGPQRLFEGCALKVFALRPAPIIVNWLGYPGTMGSPYHHYIIADDYIIPRGHEIYYSEKVRAAALLPAERPQARHRRRAANAPRSRAAGRGHGLLLLQRHAENHACGLRPLDDDPVARAGQRAVVPRRGRGHEGAAAATGDAARHRAGAAVFAARSANPEHMARFALADLLLDTCPTARTPRPPTRCGWACPC